MPLNIEPRSISGIQGIQRKKDASGRASRLGRGGVLGRGGALRRPHLISPLLDGI